ncbi:MAG: MFS transporter [Streptomyces sp.]|uniref:MFS transporter n=1 Tax=Streptomyces sp. TaxID=1931 RepID=UPI0025CE3E38|nr:MFS transporter [Streptomyces sp.]MBW8799865.1 MFS transporter [Streptomyces sp.]
MSAVDKPADVVAETAVGKRLPANYWRLWGSSTSSNLGDGVRATAIPLLAAALDPRPIVVAALSAVGYLPWLVFSLIAGGVADRVDRRRLMIRLQLVRIAVMGSFSVLVTVGRGEIVVLFAVALVIGVTEVFFDTTAATAVPSVLPSTQLEQGNSRLYAAEITANEFVGSPLGAGLFALRPAAPFWFGLLGSSTSGLLLSRITVPFNPPSADDDTAEQDSFAASIRDGVRMALASPFLRAWTVVLSMANLARAMTISVFVLYVLDLLHGGKLTFGVLTAMSAVGGLAGGWRADLLIERLGRRAAAVLGTTLMISSNLILGLVVQTEMAALAGFMFGAGVGLNNVLFISMRQRMVPPEYLGRVASVQRFVSWGLLPLGALLGGWLAASWNLRAPYLVAGVLVAVFALLFGRSLMAFPEVPTPSCDEPVIDS